MNTIITKGEEVTCMLSEEKAVDECYSFGDKVYNRNLVRESKYKAMRSNNSALAPVKNEVRADELERYVRTSRIAGVESHRNSFSLYCPQFINMPIKGSVTCSFQFTARASKPSYFKTSAGIALVGVPKIEPLTFYGQSILIGTEWKTYQFTASFEILESQRFNYFIFSPWDTPLKEGEADTFYLDTKLWKIEFEEPTKWTITPEDIIPSLATRENLLHLVTYAVPEEDKFETLVIGADNIAKLRPEEIALATEKGWVII